MEDFRTLFILFYPPGYYSNNVKLNTLLPILSLAVQLPDNRPIY